MSRDFHVAPVSHRRNSSYDGRGARVNLDARDGVRQKCAAIRPCQQVCEQIMNKPSERIVVFVTTAQKRAITATADNLGISVSELMRRAVLSFGATSEQVKAASIVDRLRAPRAPDALDAALQRVARGTRYARPPQPAARQPLPDDQTHAATASASAEPAPSAAKSAAAPTSGLPSTPAATAPAPLLPAGVLAALAAAADAEAAATAEAVARVTAAESAESGDPRSLHGNPDASLRDKLKRPRLDPSREEDDDPRSDPSTGGGRFA
jgi:hypothetical protein